MTKSEHRKPTNFVGLYFVDEEGSETGQIIAQISDGYWPSSIASKRTARHPDWKSCPPLTLTGSATVVVRDTGDSLLP
jgi:hypothetical protein